MSELDRILDNHASLASDGPFSGPLMTESEVFGKAHYACAALNPGRRRSILSRIKEINWCSVMNRAIDRGLVRCRDQLRLVDAIVPIAPSSWCYVRGASHYHEYRKTAEYDPAVIPWE